MGVDSFESCMKPIDIARQYAGGERILEIESVGRGEYVAAVPCDMGGRPGVYAVVVVVESQKTGPGGRAYHRVRVMGENEGPYYGNGVSPMLLAKLSPAPGEYAAAWRSRAIWRRGSRRD